MDEVELKEAINGYLRPDIKDVPDKLMDIFESMSAKLLNEKIKIAEARKKEFMDRIIGLYQKELSDIIIKMRNQYSKYSYIKEGKDFLNHLKKVSATDTLQRYMSNIYIIEKDIVCISRELEKRNEFLIPIFYNIPVDKGVNVYQEKINSVN